MHFPARKGQNGGTATHLVTLLMFVSFLTRNIVFLCCTEQILCCADTKGGGLRAGGLQSRQL